MQFLNTLRTFYVCGNLVWRFFSLLKYQVCLIGCNLDLIFSDSAKLIEIPHTLKSIILLKSLFVTFISYTNFYSLHRWFLSNVVIHYICFYLLHQNIYYVANKILVPKFIIRSKFTLKAIFGKIICSDWKTYLQYYSRRKKHNLTMQANHKHPLNISLIVFPFPYHEIR